MYTLCSKTATVTMFMETSINTQKASDNVTGFFTFHAKNNLYCDKNYNPNFLNSFLTTDVGNGI